jgi:hypothetical protein
MLTDVGVSPTGAVYGAVEPLYVPDSNGVPPSPALLGVGKSPPRKQTQGSSKTRS